MAVRVVILGGGPAGNTAATYAARLGAEVTLIQRDVAGGAAHPWDCIPSKTMNATGGPMSLARPSVSDRFGSDGRRVRAHVQLVRRQGHPDRQPPAGSADERPRGGGRNRGRIAPAGGAPLQGRPGRGRGAGGRHRRGGL